MRKLLAVLVLCVFVMGSIAYANNASNMLSIYSKSKRAEVLTGVVNSAGFSCGRVTVSFYKGVDKDDGAYWDVACTNGISYTVQITSDSSTKVISCALMNQIGVTCFKEFD